MRENGMVLSRTRLMALCIFFVGSLVAVGLLVYFFADRPSESSPATQVRPVLSGARAKPVKNVRLPRTVLPDHYEVWLMPVIQVGNFTIPGNVSVVVQCRHETDHIVLHSANIAINKKSVRVSWPAWQVLTRTNTLHFGAPRVAGIRSFGQRGGESRWH